MQDTLNQYGHTFQVKVLSCLLTDRIFTSSVYDILDTNYFDTESLKWIAKNTLLYYNEYKKLPTLDVFKVQVSNLQQDSLLKTEVVSTLREVFKSIESQDLDFVKITALDFCKNQELKKAILKSVDLLKVGKYDEIKAEIDAAVKKGAGGDLGHDYLNEIDKRYDEGEVLKRISTGWPIIDDLMGGGLPIKKFGFMSGDKGAGKSFTLVHLGAEALKLGYDVVHWTLELDENYVAYRYDAKLANIPLDDLKFHISDIKKRLAKYPGKLIIKEFPTKSIGMNGLRSHRDKLHLTGFRPTLFLVDYLDLLKVHVRGDMRKDEALEELYEEFRGFCGESEAAGWTVSQGNRTGSNKSLMEADTIAGAYSKGAVADFWMSIGRNNRDKLNNGALFNIIKNRFGPDGMHLPALFDTSKSHIEIFNEKSETGKKIKEKVLSGEEYEMQYAAQQFQRLANQNRKEPIDLF